MSAFGKYNPIALAVYFVAVLLIAMFVNNPIIQFLALIGGIVFCLMLKRKGGFGIYTILFVLIALTNPLFSHNGATPLLFINGNAITLEAIIYGFALGITIVAVLIWFRCLSVVMTSDRMLYLFGRVIPKLSLVLSMALRFIPMITRQSKKLYKAQQAMGIYSSDNSFDKFRGTLKIFNCVVGWAFEKAIDTSASMKARGYGLTRRTSFGLFKFSKRDGILIAITSLLTAVCLAGVGFGLTEFNYYPRIDSLNFSPGTIFIYIAYGVLALIPFIIEAKEVLVWKFCVSKI